MLHLRMCHAIIVVLLTHLCSRLDGLKSALNGVAGWVVVLGLRPFETVFQSISDRLPARGRKKSDMIDERKTVQTPHPHILQAQ